MTETTQEQLRERFRNAQAKRNLLAREHAQRSLAGVVKIDGDRAEKIRLEGNFSRVSLAKKLTGVDERIYHKRVGAMETVIAKGELGRLRYEPENEYVMIYLRYLVEAGGYDPFNIQNGRKEVNAGTN